MTRALFSVTVRLPIPDHHPAVRKIAHNSSLQALCSTLQHSLTRLWEEAVERRTCDFFLAPPRFILCLISPDQPRPTIHAADRRCSFRLESSFLGHTMVGLIT